MVTIKEKYKLRKLNLSDLSSVMKFKDYDDVMHAMDYINHINKKCLEKGFDYYAIFEKDLILGLFSYNTVISSVVKFECISDYKYEEDFHLIINHIKDIFSKNKLAKFDISVDVLNDSLKYEICKSGFNNKENLFSSAFKTLVFNGSPKNGVSKKICDELVSNYSDVEVVNAYEYNIKACTDCGFCAKHACECIYKDMDEIYKLIEDAANIIIVTPVHVGSVSAPLLAMFSRLQIYFANKFFLKNDFPFSKKQGFAIAVSGKDWDGQRSGVKVVFKHALLEMNADFNYYTYLSNSDDKSDFESQLNGFYREVDKYVRK